MIAQTLALMGKQPTARASRSPLRDRSRSGNPVPTAPAAIKTAPVPKEVQGSLAGVRPAIIF